MANAIATQNKYSYPVELTNNVKMTYKESPAHVGRLKYAVDFVIPIGTEVKAAARGVVVDVKENSSISGEAKKYDKYGNYIEIKHSNGEYSIYEHIRKGGSFVKKGDRIKSGQVIGYSGKTGWIAHLGPHLHFDVHKYFGKGPEDYKALKIVWKQIKPQF